MKRWLTAMLALCMLLGAASAQAEHVSVTELREQIEAMSRWTQTYEAHGRKIDVNVPIIVPDVSTFPIVKVVPHALFEGETRIALPVEDLFTGAVQEAKLYSGHKYDSVVISLNTPGGLMYSRQKDYLKDERTCYYPWEIEGREHEINAEENPLSLADAEQFVKDVINDLYGENEGYALEYIKIGSRPRKTKGDVNFEYGDTVDYYPYGTYYMSLRATVNNIPVYDLSISLFDPEMRRKNKVHDDSFIPLDSLDMIANVLNPHSFQVLSILLKQQEVLVEDAPLAPVSTILESIEQEIMAGRVRNVYALRLGYVCFLNEDSPEAYTVYPVWVCECDYTKTAKEEGSVYILDAGTRDGTKFGLLGINAITGEVFDRRTPSQKSLYCPQ